jgi:hypothetical protein
VVPLLNEYSTALTAVRVQSALVYER